MGASLPSSSRGRSRRRAPMAEINVTPFVDVMLVLLIIFMVTAPLLTSAVPVDLPESNASPLEQDQVQITITIDREGLIYIDDGVVAPGGFGRAIESLGQAGERPLVTLRADRGLDYGSVVAVMGELNRAGFNSIALVTSGSDAAP